MKKFTLLLMVVFAALVGLTSCVDEGAKLYGVKIQVNYPDGYGQSVASDVLVTIVNTTTSVEDTASTDITGIAEINLPEGSYNISAGTESEEFYFNGSTQGLFVAPGENNFEIDLVASSKGGGLILSEVYYCGSKTAADANYNADQFHEIYNNSDDTLYLDGLCIGILKPIPSATSVAAWQDGSGNPIDRLPITFHSLMFPGTGKTYPIYPRTSVVLAQDAIDHQSDPLGNPLSPVNLANAEFETYIELPGKDTDAPNADNLIIMYVTTASMSEWSVYTKGSAVVLFRLPTGLDYASYVADPNNFMTEPGSTSTIQFFMIDKSYVIDAVEEVYPDATMHYKRLPVSVDAGIVFQSGSNISKSIRRKVKMVLDGKVIYQDTNNSTNDFIPEATPTPNTHPATVDAK